MISSHTKVPRLHMTCIIIANHSQKYDPKAIFLLHSAAEKANEIITADFLFV